MTVFTLSRGIALMPSLAASSSALIGGGVVVRSTGITSPFFNGGASSLRGTNATYCSPIAEVLWTSAVRSDGMSIPLRRESTASTSPLSFSRTALTRPTSVPR